MKHKLDILKSVGTNLNVRCVIPCCNKIYTKGLFTFIAISIMEWIAVYSGFWNKYLIFMVLLRRERLDYYKEKKN